MAHELCKLQVLATCALLCSIAAVAGADDSSSATSQASASPIAPVNLLNASRLSNATNSSTPAEPPEGLWSMVPMLLGPDSSIQRVMLRSEPVRGGYYIVVAFLGAIQFDDVIYKATAAGQESMVAIRIDKTCQLIWAVGGSQGAYRIGEGSSGQLSRRLSAASVSPVTGSLLLLGDFGLDDISFGNTTLARAENPHAHCFLASLDATTGKVAWAIAFTGDTLLQCQDISHDASGNAYVSGRCVGNCTFGSFTLTTTAVATAAASDGWDGPYPAAFAAFIVRVNSIGLVDWMDHLDAAPGVNVNHTRIATDTTTKLTTVAVSMASFDTALGAQTGAAISLLSLWGDGSRSKSATPFTASAEAGLAAFSPSFGLAGFRAAGGMLYLSANAAGNMTLSQASLASNVTDLVQQPHDGSSRSLLAAYNATTLEAAWMTVLASNDSSFGVAASHMDVEPAQNQVYVVGAFRETLQVAASTNMHSLTANLTLASASPIGFLAAIHMANGSANWTAQYAGWPSEVVVVTRPYQASTWRVTLWGGSTTARHLHVAGVGWNLNASGMLDGPHWGMQQEADGHIVQVQLPHTAGDENLIWGMKPRTAAITVFGAGGFGGTCVIGLGLKIALAFFGI